MMDSDLAVLYEHIQDAIQQTISTKKIGLAFSGGVDSSLLAKICQMNHYDVTLLTVGFADSHDIDFAKQVNAIYEMPHHTLDITKDSFAQVLPKIQGNIHNDSLSWLENSIAFYYVAKLARRLGLDVVCTANGIDELFCGYNAYREVFNQGESSIIQLMDKKIQNELAMMKTISSIASEFDVQIVQPLLNDKFIKFAKTIPIHEKITNPDDLIRKHIIRRLAKQCGVPSISYQKRKKALQYGTKIHKAVIKSRSD